MASEDLKHLIAREIASGDTIARIARRHGRSWKGIRRLVDTPEMQQRIQAERQRVAELGEECRARLFQLGPKALENIARVVGNPRHPKCLETSRFVVEKILPARAMVEVEGNVGASASLDAESKAVLAQAFIDISKSLKEFNLAQSPGRGLSRVRTGPEALLRPLPLPDGRGDR